jgi:hypothetical protein
VRSIYLNNKRLKLLKAPGLEAAGVKKFSKTKTNSIKVKNSQFHMVCGSKTLLYLQKYKCKKRVVLNTHEGLTVADSIPYVLQTMKQLMNRTA